ncbi:carbon storage regulator [Aeoliella sp.]|uniref:carbon storage regulator n=1 Tax=Aeoliella sp. TaxID=2795800 RepID=UPI003CCB95CB
MLVLSRKIGQSICLPGSETTITVTKAARHRVSLAIQAPRKIKISRGELEWPDKEDTVVEEDTTLHWRPKPKSRAIQTAKSCSAQRERASILVAITDSDERRRYADALCGAGYRTSEATDGLSCLLALRSTPLDMLVIDQHLLWGSGDGVIEVMHHDPSIKEIPVVLLTFPKPDEPTTALPSQRELDCDEIINIVQRSLAGSM